MLRLIRVERPLRTVGGQISLTLHTIHFAAKNQFSGEALMKLLVDRREADVQITDDVVLDAAANGSSGEAVIALLLDRRDDFMWLG